MEKLKLVIFTFLLWSCSSDFSGFLLSSTPQSFIVMVSGCSYYFDSSKDKEGDADVGMGVKMAWVNHIGSIAFGSFIIALVEFIRIVVAVVVE